MANRQQHLFDTEPAPWELDDAEQRLIASVVFAEMPYGPFDYEVPSALLETCAVGCRVEVPLGQANRSRVGYCVGLELRRETRRRLKDVRAVVDARALLSADMLRLCEWIAEYYLCPLGVALDAVLPAGVRSQAGTRQVTLLSVPAQVSAKLTQLKLPAKQAQALKLLASSPEPMTAQQLARIAKCTLSPIQGLRAKRLIVAHTQRVRHLDVTDRHEPRTQAWALNAEQDEALAAIRRSLTAGKHETLLLHGVTGSGKTEVYIRAIEEVIQFGRQAIVLVPEISLTPQTHQRFRSRFDRVAVLHSHLTDAERHWHWQQIAEGRIQVVVGARSAVFAPTRHLGLIVVDEEHDASFKQDIAPRYHACQIARQRALGEKIPLILGSATPSLDSWQRASQGKYRLVELQKRVLDRPLPDVVLIDLRTEFRKSGGRGAISRPLYQAIRQTLAEQGQVILLLNRRGYSTCIQCPACGETVRCPHCDITLTHHREEEKALCHYCDFTQPAPSVCPECGFSGIRYSGFGTQRLEREVHARFPGVACLRMDSDSMQKPGSHEHAFARFRTGEVKILVGTQMIAKGLDFPNVTLVGVINADTALHFPDFRAAERTFQLVTQVAGRTGRGDRGGRVMVQTFTPEHPALQAAARHDYAAFAEQELPLRTEFSYPPASAMVRLVIRGSSETLTEQFAEQMCGLCSDVVAQLGVRIRLIGPAPAPIAKLRGKYRFHALLQGADREALRTVVIRATEGLKAPDDVQWIVDVDPLDLL